MVRVSSLFCTQLNVTEECGPEPSRLRPTRFRALKPGTIAGRRQVRPSRASTGRRRGAAVAAGGGGARRGAMALPLRVPPRPLRRCGGRRGGGVRVRGGLGGARVRGARDDGLALPPPPPAPAPAPARRRRRVWRRPRRCRDRRRRQRRRRRRGRRRLRPAGRRQRRRRRRRRVLGRGAVPAGAGGAAADAAAGGVRWGDGGGDAVRESRRRCHSQLHRVCPPRLLLAPPRPACPPSCSPRAATHPSRGHPESVTSVSLAAGWRGTGRALSCSGCLINGHAAIVCHATCHAVYGCVIDGVVCSEATCLQ
jgi:hypothetical protein